VRRLFSLLAFFATVVGIVAFAATPQKGRLGGGKSAPFVNDGGWQEFGMIGLLSSDGGPIGEWPFDAGDFIGGVRNGVLGGIPRGTLRKEEIKQVVTAHTQEIAACYDGVIERAGKAGPVPRGKVQLMIEIGSAGQVDRASVLPVTLDDAVFGACVSDRVMKWVFPRPEGNGPVSVNYPLMLRPSE
jgi:hypothetical protein